MCDHHEPHFEMHPPHQMVRLSQLINSIQCQMRLPKDQTLDRMFMVIISLYIRYDTLLYT